MDLIKLAVAWDFGGRIGQAKRFDRLPGSEVTEQMHDVEVISGLIGSARVYEGKNAVDRGDAGRRCYRVGFVSSWVAP